MTNISNNNQPHAMKNTKQNTKLARDKDLHGKVKSRKSTGGGSLEPFY